MPTVINFQERREKTIRHAQAQKWESDEEKLRFLIQDDQYEGIYLNMLDYYGSSMAHVLVEKFIEQSKGI
jgi:hypothetical protein